MKIKQDTIVKASEALSTAELDGEAIVLDINSGHYYGLNVVGTKILDLIQQPRQVREVIDGVHEHFEVEREQLQVDVMTFLDELLERKLVTIPK